MKSYNFKIINIISLFFLTSCFIGSGKNSEIIFSSNKQFPKISGIDLNGNGHDLPEAFKGKYNLIAIGFEREHQEDINTWIKVADQIIQEKANINFYEIPVIYKLGSFSRLWVNNGMRLGIQDKNARKRTITVYLDREKFFENMQMKGDRIYVLLLDNKGKILWKTEGKANENSLKSLNNFIKKL